MFLDIAFGVNNKVRIETATSPFRTALSRRKYIICYFIIFIFHTVSYSKCTIFIFQNMNWHSVHPECAKKFLGLMGDVGLGVIVKERFIDCQYCSLVFLVLCNNCLSWLLSNISWNWSTWSSYGSRKYSLWLTEQKEFVRTSLRLEALTQRLNFCWVLGMKSITKVSPSITMKSNDSSISSWHTWRNWWAQSRCFSLYSIINRYDTNHVQHLSYPIFLSNTQIF